MKLVLISDTHEQHNKVTIPECDVLIHAGDLTYRGDYEQTYYALKWLNNQPAQNIVLVAGNHDFLFEKHPDQVEDLLGQFKKIEYLENQSKFIGPYLFYGSPVTPWFHSWAFNVNRGADIQKVWHQIPANTDVLITHGPPEHILDQANANLHTEHCGCYDLRQEVKKIKPKIHVFGHIHGGYGTVKIDETTFYNASVCDESYKPVNKPFEAEI